MRISLFLLLFLLASCSYKPVMITSVKNVKTANFIGEKAEIDFNLEIQNPNGFKIVLKEYDFNVSVNGKTLGKTLSNGKLVINRKSKTELPLKLGVDYKDFMAAAIGGIGLLVKAEPVTFSVNGSLKGRVWWFKKNIPLDYSQKVKL